MTTFEPGARLVFTHGRRVSPRSTAFFASSPAPSMTDGFEVLVQLVIAAITTAPWSSSNSVPSAIVTGAGAHGGSAAAEWCWWLGLPGRPPDSAGVAGGSLAGKDSAELSSSEPFSGSCSTASPISSPSSERKSDAASVSATRSWGRRGPAREGTTVGEVELERVAVHGLLGVGLVEEPLLAAVGLHELHPLGRAAGELEVAQGLGVDREDRAGGAHLGRHVPDRGPVGQRAAFASPGP